MGEEGIDADGLTKEFFTLVMDALRSGTGGYVMFEGADAHLLPVLSEEFHQSWAADCYVSPSWRYWDG